MLKILFISLTIFCAFLVEFFLFNTFGRWVTPNLILLCVVFFVLSFGIRYGIFAALWGGMLMDSFSISFFGLNMFAFVVCAYLTVLLRQYIYHHNIIFSRVLLIGIISLANILIHYVLYSIKTDVSFMNVVKFVSLPEILLTALAANTVFNLLKKCVSNLSVSS